MRHYAHLLTLTLLATALPGAAMAQVTFKNLGTLPDGNKSYATSVSGDGQAVVGRSNSSTGWKAVMWTDLGIQDLGVPLGGTNPVANALSRDGNVAVGS